MAPQRGCNIALIVQFLISVHANLKSEVNASKISLHFITMYTLLQFMAFSKFNHHKFHSTHTNEDPIFENRMELN